MKKTSKTENVKIEKQKTSKFTFFVKNLIKFTFFKQIFL